MAKDVTIKGLDKGKNVYNIVFWITEGGNVNVRANSKKQAVRKVNWYLDTHSVDGDLAKRFDPAHREWEVIEFDSEEIDVA